MAGRQKRRGLVPGASVRRILLVSAFLPIASRAPLYVRLAWELLVDARVPASRKALVAGALAYLVVPFDVIRDDVPILGALDDLVVVVLATDLFFDGVPAEVLDEKLADLGVDRVAFERDLGQIRRLTPRPIRRLIRRVPDAVDIVVGAARATGLGSRVRDWINKEGSFA
jgi:uncharacterized membrane protein YkvA (DUF1232 family)